MKIRKLNLPGTSASLPSTPVEPTPEEKRNGWTSETLTAYLAERESQQRDFAKAQSDSNVRVARSVSVTTFDPHSW